MNERTKDLTPPYGRFLIRLTKPFPDFDFSFIKPVRQRAVELLNLKPGDRVLDVGCRPGVGSSLQPSSDGFPEGLVAQRF